MVKKPLITRNKDCIIISLNGRKLIEPINKYKGMTDEEILNKFMKVRNIRNINRA